MRLPDHDIVILGAGLGGLGMASRLKAAGHDRFVILEQADALGGTWRDNIYPGAACDTESHLYCYDFAPHPTVSRLYARQPELLRYAQRVADDADLGRHLRFGCRVTAAAWIASDAIWRITLADESVLTARVFIPAWGQLNRPALPDIEGLATFEGTSFHSARWPAELDLTGKRVASIGNAASAIQYIPEVAPDAAWLTVFQRSPNWIVPRGDRAYDQAELQRYAEDPEAFRESRAALFAWRETTFQRMLEGSDEARELEAIALAHAAAQIADPVLRAKLIPDFPLGCKRVLRSDDYFPALSRPNVTLETTPIERIVPEGIVVGGGRLTAVDVIIYGTGFETQSFQGAVDVYGRDGRSLREAWRGGAHAYLGMAVAGFPNMFLIYGPNTNLGHNSILSMFEAQFGYILQALDLLLGQPGIALDVKASVMRSYDDALQAEMAGTAWSGSCTSWYKNAAGRVVNNWSGPVEAYRRLTARFDAGDYDRMRAADA